MEICGRIKMLREACGLSQKQVADAIDVTRQSISNWEIDIRSISAEHIIKLSDFFNISSDYLLGREEYFRKDGGQMINAIDKKIISIKIAHEKVAEALQELEELLNG